MCAMISINLKKIRVGGLCLHEPKIDYRSGERPFSKGICERRLKGLTPFIPSQQVPTRIKLAVRSRSNSADLLRITLHVRRAAK